MRRRRCSRGSRRDRGARSTPADLAEQLGPWIAAARAAGAAGVLACRVLRADGGTDRPGWRRAGDRIDDLLAARRDLEAEFADVARGAVLALVDAALERLGVSSARSRGDGAIVAVLSGGNPAPGDRELVEFLGGAGMRAHLGDDPDADLLIVTRTARRRARGAAATRAVPLLGLGPPGAARDGVGLGRPAVAGPHPHLRCPASCRCRARRRGRRLPRPLEADRRGSAGGCDHRRTRRRSPAVLSSAVAAGGLAAVAARARPGGARHVLPRSGRIRALAGHAGGTGARCSQRSGNSSPPTGKAEFPAPRGSGTSG